jgi:hypothetical protein
MFDHSYLKATGQTWKLALLFAFPAIGLGMIALALSGIIGEAWEVAGKMFLLGMCLSVVGLTVPILTIKCPSCKTLLLWRAFRDQEASGWLSYLLMQETCFICGHKP